MATLASSLTDHNSGNELLVQLQAFEDKLAFVNTYAGSPESNVTAVVGSICFDTTNGVAYMKKTGTGNTGWKLVTQAA